MPVLNHAGQIMLSIAYQDHTRPKLVQSPASACTIKYVRYPLAQAYLFLTLGRQLGVVYLWITEPLPM